MAARKANKISMTVPFDLGTVLDLLLIGAGNGTVFNQGERVAGGLKTGFTTAAWSTLFPDGSPYITELSQVLAAYSSGKLGEAWRTRSETKTDFQRWEPGVSVERRDSLGNAKVVKANNNGVLVTKCGNNFYAHEVMPANSRAFVRPGKDWETIELDGFPIPQIIIENVLVATLFNIRGVNSPANFGYLYRYITDSNGRIESVGCEDEILSWCVQTITKWIKDGTVMVKFRTGDEPVVTSIAKVTKRGDGVTLTDDGGRRYSRNDILSIIFIGSKL